MFYSANVLQPKMRNYNILFTCMNMLLQRWTAVLPRAAHTMAMIEHVVRIPEALDREQPRVVAAVVSAKKALDTF